MKEQTKILRLDQSRFTSLSCYKDMDLQILESATGSECHFTIVESRADEICARNAFLVSQDTCTKDISNESSEEKSQQK